MLTDRLITVAIHTYERAHRLKELLENEHIPVTLQNVNLTNPSISAGVRVRIKECDLPQALRLIENIEILSPDVKIASPIHSDGNVLVPTDFSAHSMQAALVAFRIAAAKGCNVHLLHSYIEPAMTNNPVMQFSDDLTFDNENEIIATEMAERDTGRIVHKSMEDFRKALLGKITTGVIPGVKFTTEIVTGMPEDAINDYCSAHRNILTVMGTHGSDSNSRELLGSVTAEVLDGCRSAVLTVPADTAWATTSMPSSTLFFVTPGQEDILVLDTLYRMFPDTSLKVSIAVIPAKNSDPESTARAAGLLLSYCRENYPAFSFKTLQMSVTDPIADFDRLRDKHPIDMIVIGNKRKNAFSRFFSPTLAHRLLFHTDVPLLSIPV